MVSTNLTRLWADGGRDALGDYRIGTVSKGVNVDFSIEVKYYGQKNGVGVKLTSRLVSRLKNKQFGVIVTTSYIAAQAQKEILEDGHPVIFIAAVDILNILDNSGIKTLRQLDVWMEKNNYFKR